MHYTSKMCNEEKNNPLKYTDPTGHSWLSKLWKKFKNVVIAVVVAAVAYFTAGAVLDYFGYSSFAHATAMGATAVQGATISGYGAIVASGAAAGAVAGFSGTLLNGGSLGQALRAGAIGGLFGAISAGIANEIGTAFGDNSFAKALAHGVSRSVLAKAQGGRWSSGFWSGFASSVFGEWTSSIQNTNLRFAMTAIAGGTVSQLSGGKFANGAVSSAFVWMFNEHSHESVEKLPSINKAEFAQLKSSFEEPGLIDISDIFVPIGRLFAGIGKLFGIGVKNTIPYRIGANANQEYHAWRYVDADGVSREAVKREIEALLQNMELKSGFNKGIINVENHTYQINMYKLEDNTINIGTIHVPTRR